MADISRYLQEILDAIYGEEVRGSIHDAIDIINKVGEKVMTVGTEVTSTTSSSAGFYLGSLYINSDTAELWKCTGTNAWESQGVLRGKDGNVWYSGTAISGKNVAPTIFSDSGIEEAHTNDCYINSEEKAIYHCVTSGTPNTATWSYDFTIAGGGGSSAWGDIIGKPFDAVGLGLSSVSDGYQNVLVTDVPVLLRTFTESDITSNVLYITVPDGDYNLITSAESFELILKCVSTQRQVAFGYIQISNSIGSYIELRTGYNAIGNTLTVSYHACSLTGANSSYTSDARRTTMEFMCTKLRSGDNVAVMMNYNPKQSPSSTEALYVLDYRNGYEGQEKDYTYSYLNQGHMYLVAVNQYTSEGACQAQQLYWVSVPFSENPTPILKQISTNGTSKVTTTVSNVDSASGSITFTGTSGFYYSTSIYDFAGHCY